MDKEKGDKVTIQIITNNSNIQFQNIKNINRLHRFSAFGCFKINIIDLSYEEIWVNNHSSRKRINCISDLKSLKDQIDTSDNTYSIIVLPQNIIFKSNRGPTLQGNYVYSETIRIKDCLPDITNFILPSLTSAPLSSLIFENNETILNNIKYHSSFSFKRNCTGQYTQLTLSEHSKRITSIMFRKTIITTLDILENEDKLMNYLAEVNLLDEEKEFIPEWLNSYNILDDEEQKIIIENCKKEIEKANQKIIAAESVLDNNLKFKSILYENGDSLVKHVFTILEEILKCTLSDFEDMKKEDFLIKFDDITFIGEIKGVTSNVKYEHVSQVDTNAHIYMDKLVERGECEAIKQLLIINPIRNKPLDQREQINQDQINLAERNKSLIITTETLLKLFEKYRNNEVTTETIKDKLTNEIGLLDFGVFNNGDTYDQL